MSEAKQMPQEWLNGYKSCKDDLARDVERVKAASKARISELEAKLSVAKSDAETWKLRHDVKREQMAKLKEQLSKSAESRGWMYTKNLNLEERLYEATLKLQAVESQLAGSTERIAELEASRAEDVALIKGLTQKIRELQVALKKEVV